MTSSRFLTGLLFGLILQALVNSGAAVCFCRLWKCCLTPKLKIKSCGITTMPWKCPSLLKTWIWCYAFNVSHKSLGIWRTFSACEEVRINAYLRGETHTHTRTIMLNYNSLLSYMLLHSKQEEIKSNRFHSRAYSFDFFFSSSQWIINKLISLYSSIFGDLK